MKKQNPKTKWVRSIKYGTIAAGVFCLLPIIFFAILSQAFTGEFLAITFFVGLATFIIFGIIFTIGVRVMIEHWIGVFVPAILILIFGKFFPFGFMGGRIGFFSPTLAVFVVSLVVYAILRRNLK